MAIEILRYRLNSLRTATCPEPDRRVITIGRPSLSSMRQQLASGSLPIREHWALQRDYDHFRYEEDFGDSAASDMNQVGWLMLSLVAVGPGNPVSTAGGARPSIVPLPNGPSVSTQPILPLKPYPGPMVNLGRQGKHIPGHNNYMPGKSILRVDPNVLAQQAGKGVSLRKEPVGQPGSRELIDFGRCIGDHVDEMTGVAAPTSWGIITYGKDGVHIFPVRPQVPRPNIQP